MLRTDGQDLRRPIAAYLRDGIYELRIRYGNVNYRMLYFFSGMKAAVVSHGIVKHDKVPGKEIDFAVRRMELFEQDPERYSYYEEGI